MENIERRPESNSSLFFRITGEQCVERIVLQATLDELLLGEDSVVVGVHLLEDLSRPDDRSIADV